MPVTLSRGHCRGPLRGGRSCPNSDRGEDNHGGLDGLCAGDSPKEVMPWGERSGSCLTCMLWGERSGSCPTSGIVGFPASHLHHMWPLPLLSHHCVRPLFLLPPTQTLGAEWVAVMQELMTTVKSVSMVRAMECGTAMSALMVAGNGDERIDG